jgi:NAD(P)-dependent dehydrogenase (short-subunit alcohol dehydrogenase family)
MSSLNLGNLFDVKDKVVVITGGGRGIGKMMADGFVQNGARVYIASRNLKACQETAHELNAKGPGKCIPVRQLFIIYYCYFHFTNVRYCSCKRIC